MIRSNIFKKHNVCGILVLTWKCTVSFATSTSREDINYKDRDIFKEKETSGHLQSSSIHSRQHTSVGNTVFHQHKHWSTYFQDSGVPDPELSSKYIIEHVLNIKKAYEYDLSMKRKVTVEEENQIRKLCECRLARMPVQYIIKEWDFRDLKLVMSPPVFIPRPETEQMPVQYIIKEWDFRDLKLVMSPPVFIPRPETEQLVELVLERVTPDSVVLEVGCGSGAICLSLLKAVPQAQVVAIDQSRLACELTNKNAELNCLATNLKVVHSKLQDDGTLSQPLDLDSPVDIIVSNPPYVPYAQLLDLQPEIKLYEDLRALEAGRDGLRLIRSLLTFASSSLRPNGLMFLEVDSSHPKLIEQWVMTHPELNIQFVRSYKDFCDKDRFVELKKV